METFYYNLSGGINQSSTKTNLGLDVKNIHWADAENVEILQNKGVIKQKGNTKITQISDGEKITGLHQMKYGKTYRLIITTQTGKLFVYNPDVLSLTKLNKTLSGTKPSFKNFLNGVIVSSEKDALFFIKNNSSYDIEECNLKDAANSDVKSNIVAIYKGRIWVAADATIYFSALGSYNDFTTADDAGYISNFYTNTDEIISLKPYKEYLAIYKKNSVYLLTGNNPEDFSIIQFADKGATSPKGIVNVNNKQYFLTQGIFALEVGELNQILMSDEITGKIKPEFNKFDSTRMNESIAIHYEAKNQVWYFIPYKNDKYFHTIWINDYLNKAWYKRVVPQDITTAAVFKDYIVTADKEGKVYREDYGTNFDGEPVKFMWKSPFLSLGNPNIRKTIDEFYFVLDESYENNFKFSVYKNFDSENQDDKEEIFSTNFENLHWEKENSNFVLNNTWGDSDEETVWAVSADTMYKAEISESNYAIQLCIEGDEIQHSAAIIGIEFKEIYNDE